MEKLSILCLIAALIVHYFPSTFTMRVTNYTTDQTAILAFKAHITFDPHDILENNWSTTASVCSWFGVSCSRRHPRVTALNLANLGLHGSIAPHLGNLSFLVNLNISNNSFIGQLPSELAQLRRLNLIDFSSNSLGGPLPSWFGMLHKLRYLVLANNTFTGVVPFSLCNISRLETLELNSNFLQGNIPEEIGNLRKLNFLQLSNNKLTGGIPRNIGNLTVLKQLWLAHNSLQGTIPQELGNIPKLEGLFVGVNRLFGTLHPTIFNISAIKTIAVDNNDLTGGVPSTMGLFLPNLEKLNLGGNMLSGVIPQCISNASKLIILDLSYNLFTGFVPSKLGNLEALELLNLGDNNLTSESTPQLGFLDSLTNCKKLREVWISSNLLNGALPSSIGNLSTSLEYFDASDCRIKGNIPTGIGNLSKLIELRLRGNDLMGPIPPTIGRLSKLQLLNLRLNELQGSIPNELCYLRYLSMFYLGSNKLFGSIPACLDNLVSLRKLGLGSNELNSTIPSTLWNLKDLLFLNLSFNSLVGRIPPEIEHLKVITEIYLSRNQLSGDIPNTIGGLQNLVNLSLDGNKLEGNIPSSVGRLISLEFLNLSHNHLMGVIPKTLESLLYLRYLNVSFNRLVGEIPNGGPFANFTTQSFMQNDALCGAPRLEITPCRKSTPRHPKTAGVLFLRYVLPTIASITTILALLCALIVCRKRNLRSTTQKDILPLATQARISYQELLQGTDGLNESNLLGIGSFGSVYRATLSNGIIVAIKVFNLQLEGAFKSFDVECEVLRNIRHRNLTKIISSCSNNDFKALVLKYMPNGSLEKWLYSHNYCLSILQRLNIMIDIASALDYLHHGYVTPVVHCDIKPNNVLLDENMVAHLSDFGIAKLLGEEGCVAQTKTLATIGYIAPEYGVGGIISTRGDVYSYGIVLMEIFTRKKPTDEMFIDEMSLAQWVKKSIPNAISEVIDADLLRKEEGHFAPKVCCISSIMALALNCTAEVPEERISIKDVLASLIKIKKIFWSNSPRS